MNAISCISSDTSATIDAGAYPVGTQLFGHYDKRGFIAAVKPGAANTFVVGSGLTPVRRDYVVVWDDEYVDTLSDGIVAPMVARAAHLPPAEDVEARHAAALVAMEKARTARRADQDRKAAERAAFEADALKRIPTWAKAVIVGELIEDQSDIMSDYHGSTVVKAVILGFSRHTRDLFPEMRAAARNHPDTAHLADAPAEAEHREKYSMGGGYYLKAGYRHSSGWRVEKKSFYGAPVSNIPTGEWALTPAVAATAPASGAVIEEHAHTKRGFQMFVVVMGERVDCDTFEALREQARAAGGWWSRRWGSCPSGFAFKDRTAAETFAAGLSGEPAKADVATPATGGKAERLRALADKMQGDIDHAFRDRLANTPKRKREADAARIEGERLRRTQDALRAMAAAHEAGTVAPSVVGLSSRKAVYDLLATRIDMSRAGYYDAGIDTGEPVSSSPAAVTLWGMIKGPSAADRAAEQLRREIGDLRFARIPDYFPTPEEVGERVAALAEIAPGMRVLEPSAGSGELIQAIDWRSVDVEAVEINLRLCAVLNGLFGEEITVTAAHFLSLRPESLGDRFDRVLMNPPFTHGTDIQHIEHALEFLKPGGRLVAICAGGPRQRDALKPLSCHWEELPAGTFKAQGTDVAAALLVIERDDVEAARAGGWEHGGDCGGSWFHGPTWGGDWKAAASWSGTDNAPDGADTKPKTYDTLAELCEAEGLGSSSHA